MKEGKETEVIKYLKKLYDKSDATEEDLNKIILEKTTENQKYIEDIMKKLNYDDKGKAYDSIDNWIKE